MNHLQVPLARKEGLVIQEMPEEVLVYDMDTNKAHCLNKTAAFVWKSCDGNNSVADITKLAGNDSNSTVPEDLIWLAIEQLSEKNLLANAMKADFKGSTRREVIKKIGLAAVIGLPLVASLTAPTSVLAATSCRCVTVSDCTGQTTGVCPTGSCDTNGLCSATVAPVGARAESGTITIKEKSSRR